MVESLRPGANVSEVARRNGLSPQQLFAWRREAHALFREGAEPTPADRPATAPVRQPRRRKEQRAKPPEIGAGTPMFAPVVIAASTPSSVLSSSYLHAFSPTLTAAERSVEALWNRIGLLDAFSPAKCADYFKNAGYASS